MMSSQSAFQRTKQDTTRRCNNRHCTTVHPNFLSASVINTLVCGLVQSQMHNISDILFSAMNSTMVIPMCHGGHQAAVTKSTQTFLYFSTSIEHVSNNVPFKGPHITSFSFTEAPPTAKTTGSPLSLAI